MDHSIRNMNVRSILYRNLCFSDLGNAEKEYF